MSACLQKDIMTYNVIPNKIDIIRDSAINPLLKFLPSLKKLSIYLLMLIYVQALQKEIRMTSHPLHLAACLIKAFSNSNCIKWCTSDEFI